MFRTRIIITLLGLLGLSPVNMRADSPGYTFEHLSVQDGLSTNNITTLFLDSKGFIWVGTYDGLNKYDGYSFKIFRHNPRKNSVAGNQISAIAEDQQGKLWIGTSSGLSVYDRSLNQFNTFVHDPANKFSIASSDILDILVSRNGTTWVHTPGFLHRYNSENKTFTRFAYERDLFYVVETNRKFELCEDATGNIWLSTNNGLLRFDAHNQQFHQVKAPYSNSKRLMVSTLSLTTDNTLLLGCRPGLCTMKLPDKQGKNLPELSTIPLTSEITSIAADRGRNAFWLATPGNLFLYAPQSRSLVPVADENDQFANLRTITYVIVDHSGILWVGTTGGLFKVKEKSRSFVLYSPDNKANVGRYLSGRNIRSIFIDSKNRLWIGTSRNGLNLVNNTRTECTVYMPGNPSQRISGYRIQAITQDSRGRIWAGSENGIDVMDNGSTRFVPLTDFFPELKQVRHYFTNTQINAFCEDDDKQMWIGTLSGLFLLDTLPNGKKTLIPFYHNPHDKHSLSAATVTAFCPADSGRLWVATTGGLDLIDTETRKVVKKINRESTAKSLTNNTILSLLKLGPAIWIGTSSGLNRLNPTTGEITSFTQDDGLSNDYIYAIQSDNREHIWISTNHGISRYDPTTKLFINYEPADGVQDYEFNFGASYKTLSGELLFGGINGITSFFPDSIQKNHIVPKLSITGLSLIRSDSVLQYNIDSPKEILIRNNVHMFTIHFSALEFTNPQKNRYRYRLEGLNEDWIDIGNQHFATFSKIDPGTYTLHIIGSNNDGVWNESGIAVKVKVVPAFYETRTAIVIYALGMIGLVFFIIQARTKRLRTANQELKEKQRIARKIALQKEELSIKNKNITDSIHYAKRIIESMLPSEKYFYKILPRSFILNMPKDIVSGDFFWIEEKYNRIFVAVADCTGHGVPGAFMSIIGYELLGNIVNEAGVETADGILNRLNHEVARIFGPNRNEDTLVRDGMDIALCVIDKDRSIIQYAGALNPLYLLRNNNLIEYKGDRFPVGYYSSEIDKRFTRHEIPLEKGDIIYLFSDGFADQFGGPEGKKFKYRRFRHALLTLHKDPMPEQMRSLKEMLLKWKQDREQVDDILLIGINTDFINTSEIWT